MAIIVSVLPPPPKFPGVGPSDQRDWDIFYRWLQDVYRTLVVASNAAAQNIAISTPNIPPAWLVSEIEQALGLATLAYQRVSTLRTSSGSGTVYVTNATGAPMVIPAGQHGQGIAPVVQCWSGTLVNGGPTGFQVTAEVSLDPSGDGDVTVNFAGTEVGSILIMG